MKRSRAWAYRTWNDLLKFTFRTMGISTTCLASTSTAVGEDFLQNKHFNQRRHYVDVEDVIAGTASAMAKRAVHSTTENFMLLIRGVVKVVEVE